MNTANYASSDPRSIITPDAFSVAPSLVGIPLASPFRRLVAISIDLIFVAAFSFLGWYLLGITVVVVAFRAATRKSGEGTSQVFRAFRVILGCFGTSVLLIVAMAVGSILFFDDGELPSLDDIALSTNSDPGDDADPGLSLGDLVRGAVSATALGRTDDPEEASVAVAALATTLLDSGMPRSEVREVAAAWVEDDQREWFADAVETGLRRAFREGDLEEAAAAAVASDAAPVRTLDEALEEYAALVRAGDAPASTEEEVLRTQIVTALGADTLADLRSALSESRQDLRASEERLAESELALVEEQNSGFFAAVKNMAESTGLLFGWGTVYMSLFTAWWNGQTIGKKLLGIRVVRLDGKPMSGWMAFERAGGYAAGFATGLIGFAQIYWDPNRMAIHDKVTETAVIMDGAQPVPGPWSTPRAGHRADG